MKFYHSPEAAVVARSVEDAIRTSELTLDFPLDENELPVKR